MEAGEGWINPPHVMALMNAYARRYRKFDARGAEYVRRAAKRIENEETTVEMEIKKMNNQFRVW